jgi:hypothetical protein
MEDQPPCRPLALHVTDPSPSLGFALTLEPDVQHVELPGDGPALSLDARVAQQVAEALAGTDVSYL